MLKYLKIAALVAFFAPGVAHAMPVSLFELTASGTVVGTNTPGTGIEVGDAASVSLVFDANTAKTGSFFLNPNVGDVVSVFGSETFRSAGSFVLISDRPASSFGGNDSFSLATDKVTSDSGRLSGVQTQINLRDSAKIGLSTSLALPTSLLLSDFQGLFDFANIAITGSGVGTITADITSLSLTPVAAVPLPATMPMMLLGLGFAGAFLRRRKA